MPGQGTLERSRGAARALASLRENDAIHPLWRQQSAVATAASYDDYTAEYAAYVAQRERGGVDGDPMGLLPHLLALLGDMAGRVVLDAGCGEGYLARILAARGARVTRIDLAPRLIDLARARDPAGAIEYRVADLSVPLPEDVGRFDTGAAFWF